MGRRASIKVRRFWHAHRGHLVAAVVALPLLAVMVHSALAGSGPRLEPPSRAEVCHAAGQAVDEIALSHPETSQETLDTLEEQACSRHPAPAPAGAASPIPRSPGCHLPAGVGRRGPAPRRAAEPPRPVPFFAARTGRLPATGTPRAGGVQLPQGSRCGRFWSTDAGVPDSLELARALAAAFPSTGLWPVLWSASDELDSYVDDARGLARLDSLDAESLLRRAWQARTGEKRPFPGLAVAEPPAKRLAVEPFGDVLEASAEEPPPGGPILVLVPVNRPADVMAVLAMQTTIYFGDTELSAVLRSWEERFGAVVTSLSPGVVELVVGAPPRDGEQMDRLVAEHLTFAPDSGPAEDLRQLLRSGRTMPGVTSERYWALGWPD